MPRMMSQALISVDFTKTQICRYLKNELFFLLIKTLIAHQEGPIAKNFFAVEMTFKK